MFCNMLSESKRSTFEQCKLKFYYKYYKRFEEDERANTDALHFGSYIHKLFEDGVEATTFQELENLAEEYRPTYSFADSYTPKIDKCIKNFLKFNASLEKTVGVELSYEIPVKDDIKLNGIIDRVVEGTMGGYLVIDYKTSKREKSKADLYRDNQMKGYVFATHKLYDIPIDEITAAHYYPITDHLVTIRYSSNQIYAYLRNMVNEVWRIRKLKSADCTPCQNDFCNWCQYQQLCPIFNDPQVVSKRTNERKSKKRFKR